MTGAAVLPVTKVPRMTSHDVVDAVRELVGERKVGHTGTLDPAATGVLVCCVGRATKLTPYLTDLPKVYHAVCVFGVRTDTLDGEGRVTGRADAADLKALDREVVETALPDFEGTISQVPPVYSAVRHDGERLHRRARRGEQIEPEPRTVEIHSVRLMNWKAQGDGGGDAPPRALLEVRCGRGTYVRALVRDLGEALGTGAYLHFLVRRRISHFDVGGSRTLAEWGRSAETGQLRQRAWSMNRAAAHLPALVFDRPTAEGLQHGRQPRWADVQEIRGELEDGGTARCVGPAAGEDGRRLLAMAAVETTGDSWTLRLKRVLAAK